MIFKVFSNLSNSMILCFGFRKYDKNWSHCRVYWEITQFRNSSSSFVLHNSCFTRGKKAIFWQLSSVFSLQVAKLGGLPKNITDIWEFLGKPQHCRYTWDTSSNTNLRIESKCKLRFDRLYFRPAAEGGHIIPRNMDLIGLEKLDCGRFPSDHWGLLCRFDVIL